MKKIITLSLFSSLLLSNLYAKPIKLDEVTVEAANRTTQNVKDLTDSVTIITAEDIKESRVQTLTEAINRLGNIAMVSNGGLGQNSSFLLRGMDSSRVLVLIDGIRYNDITGGAQYSHLQLNSVERIEIIKGAQSGIWGSDASAGVINIITTSAQKGTHISVNAEAGSFNTQQGSVQVSHKTDNFDVLASISRVKTDGFSAAEPTRSSLDYGKRGDELGYEKDGYTNNTYDIKLGYNITDEDRLEAYMKRIDAFVEYDSFNGTDKPNYDVSIFGTTLYFDEIDNRYYSAAYKHTDDVNELSLQYNYSYLHRKVQNFKGNVQEVALQDRINYLENSFVRIGGSYQNFEHENAGDPVEKSYNAKSAYITNFNKFLVFDSLGNTIITQSLRFDSYSVFDDKTTGKFGVKQFVYDDIYLSSNYATGYNAPTLYQLYAPPSPFTGAFNNPLLEPETTKTFDITIGNDKLTATYFHNKVDDLIEYVVTDFITYAGNFQNVKGESTIKGVELGYKDDFFEMFSLNLNYTYLSAKNADGDFLRSRPKHQIDGNLFYYINEDLNIGLNGQYIGERYDRDNREGAQTGKYAVYNAVINYTINDNFTIYGKVDNIGDKYYQIRDGYATAERSFYAGLNASF